MEPPVVLVHPERRPVGDDPADHHHVGEGEDDAPEDAAPQRLFGREVEVEDVDDVPDHDEAAEEKLVAAEEPGEIEERADMDDVLLHEDFVEHSPPPDSPVILPRRREPSNGVEGVAYPPKLRRKARGVMPLAARNWRLKLARLR